MTGAGIWSAETERVGRFRTMFLVLRLGREFRRELLDQRIFRGDFGYESIDPDITLAAFNFEAADLGIASSEGPITGSEFGAEVTDLGIVSTDGPVTDADFSVKAADLGIAGIEFSFEAIDLGITDSDFGFEIVDIAVTGTDFGFETADLGVTGADFDSDAVISHRICRDDAIMQLVDQRIFADFRGGNVLYRACLRGG